MTKLRYTMFIVTVFFALVFSAVITVPALADDSTPPPETPVVEVDNPIEAAVLTETPTAEKAIVEETTSEETTIADLLALVPEETNVIVVNADGEIIPLATQEAVDAAEFIDPVWCPVGVAPRDGTGGCTSSFGSLKLLADNLMNGSAGVVPGTNGVIWIQTGPDASSDEILLDGLDVDLGNMENFSLTLNGGWNGTFGSTAITGTSTFSQVLTIRNWNNAITVNNILINGASGTGLNIATTKGITLNNVDSVNNSGNGADLQGDGNFVINNSTFTGNDAIGLVANTWKNITLNNVDAQDNGVKGADLNNLGDVAVPPGNIVINDSTFNGNGGDGLYIKSRGIVTIKNMSANGNTGIGVTILNYYGFIPKPVTFTGSNSFSHNGSHGLYIRSYGAITLNNVTAIYNANGHGAYIDNCFYDYLGYCSIYPISPVTIKGVNNFSNNGWDGLRVWSQGAITVYNITANNNGTNASRPGATNPSDPQGTGQFDGTGKGVYLYNWTYPAKPIMLIGTNTFNGNAETGLYMRSYGKITLNNITASDNGLSCNSPNDTCDGVHVRTSISFSLLGYGVFNNNQDEGMEVSSYGSISLNNLYAEGNGYYGVFADSYGPGSAVSVLGTNTFVDNTYSGLWVWSEGVVTLNNITANGNGEKGIFVNNAWKWDDNLGDWVPAGKVLTLNGTNFFNGNTGLGLELHSSGGITTNNVTALSNGDDGAYLDTCLYNSTPNDCTGLANKAVTMNGNNNISFNTGGGLYIESLGAIKANNLTAIFNGDNGAVLDNNWNGTTGSVTITGFANTSMNGIRGLAIYSRGTVTTSNLTANSNGPATSALSDETFYDGVFIANSTDPAKLMNVTLLGVNQFNDNWNSGLQISSYGVVVLNNITANNNGEPFHVANNPTPEGDGVRVNNSASSSAKSVTLNGVNFFNGNLNDGLEILSKGAILVNKVTANNNGGSGAYLTNQFDVVNSTITLLGSATFNGNLGTGLMVFSNGNITLNNVTANDSTGGGASIDNYSMTTTAVTVTLLGVNYFSGNTGGDGLVIYSDGAITLNNVTANDNNGNGAYLNNTNYQIPLKAANIILNGTNTFVNNTLHGLAFDATGNVTMTRIIADLNADGVVDGNFSAGVFGTAGGTISLACGSMNLNEGAGFNLTAGIGKLITLKGVFTHGNGLVDFSSAPTVSTRTCPLP